jgi:hypothetical protein
METSAQLEPWYRPGRSIRKFHRSKARVRFLVGARGTGKTTSDALEAVGHCWHTPGSLVLVLRKTEESQGTTAVQTFNDVYHHCGEWYVKKECSLFKSLEGGREVRVPSREAVEEWQKFIAAGPSKTQQKLWLDTEGERLCGKIIFRGLNHPTIAGSKLRSFECSMVIFVEADQLTREDFNMAILCLRLKDAHGRSHPDYNSIVDTNPPAPDHWIARLEEAGEFTDYEFWHIPMAENEHNLPPDYVRAAKAQYRDHPTMYERMVNGNYAYVYNGSPVYWGFKVDRHTMEQPSWPKGAYLVVGWDFGTHNANVFAAYWESGGAEYWWDLLERTASGSDTELQCREVLKLMGDYFPFSADRALCSGVLHFCDPAGAAKKSLGSDLDVLKSYQIFPGYRTKERGLASTLAVCNRFLEITDKARRPVYRIVKAQCPTLYAGLCGKYRYPEKGEPGYGDGNPIKGPLAEDVDHVMDAWRYAKINCLKLAGEPVERQPPPVGVLAPGVRFRNPRKRGYR